MKSNIDRLLDKAEELRDEIFQDGDGDYSPVYNLLDYIISLEHDCSRAYLLKAALDLDVLYVDDLYDSDDPLDDNINFLKAYLYANDEEREYLKDLLERNKADIAYFNEYFKDKR